MLLLIGVLLAVFVLPAPWGLVAVIVGGIIDLGETLGLMWWSKRRRSSVGAQTLIGRQAIAIGDLWPEGQVKIDGEVWKARSAGGVTTGTAVVVRGIDGLTLEVEPAGLGERDDEPPLVILRLTLEYDGSRFRGWARQPGERTVEGALRDALDAVYPGWDGLAVAGRTDTGVHATGQVASVRVDGGPPVERAAGALNTALPEDVAVVDAAQAPEDFHARFSATARSYRYVVLDRRERAPLEAGRVLWWPRPLDDDALAAAAALLPGQHDFRAFTPTETRHQAFARHVRTAGWERRGDRLHFTITADSFLRHMVRTLVGTMLEGRDLESLLAGRLRSEAGATAPACGLYLERVEY